MPSPLHRRTVFAFVGVVAAAGGAFFLFMPSAPESTGKSQTEESTGAEAVAQAKPQSAVAPRYLGTQACVECHQTEAKSYRGSHHDRAIEEPSDESVLAPFEGETFRHDGVKSTFTKKGEDFFIRTVGKKNEEQSYRVVYTFGVEPLQQYLLDAGGGRLQPFSIAWDARPKEKGGQRYFDLYPDEELSPGDEIHWTGSAQNWNFACADCHTTGLKKGYDQASDSYKLAFEELDVGCEACHGPGSRHVDWAKAGGLDSPGAGGSSDGQKGLVIALQQTKWERPPGAKVATPHLGEANLSEVETCASCHSRRQQLREGRTPDQPFMDAYVPELISEGLYHADGQINDEVYVYGSFMQSRMYQVGVRCSDCHEPHSLSLRREGNDLCSGCHSPQVYDTEEHHHHQAKGSACVDCHMPEKTYMQVDPRRDHSLRIPRPDLAQSMGAPDACTACHSDRSQEWAAARLQEWFGDATGVHYGEVFRDARLGKPSAEAQLIALSHNLSEPAIVRGTALLLLAGYPSEVSLGALQTAVSSKEALIRLGVTRGALGLALQQRVELLLPLLSDPLLAIRTEAARSLVGLPGAAIAVGPRAKVEQAWKELEKTELFYADRPEAWLRLALLELSRGDVDAADAALGKSLQLDPRFTLALVNLADLRRSQGREEEAVALLRRALSIDEENAEAWHALGLSLVRQKRTPEALPLLRRAADLRPENPRFFYVCAVALAELGQVTEAVSLLQLGLSHHPSDRSLLQVLMTYAEQAGDRTLASEAAARLAELGEPSGR